MEAEGNTKAPVHGSWVAMPGPPAMERTTTGPGRARNFCPTPT
jgi:hypothetical protein